MATRPRPHPSLHADALAGALAPLIGRDGIADQLVIGIEPDDDGHVRFHLAPLPPDERAGAAGLFGMRAHEDWCAVAATFAGRARHLDDHHVVGSATALVVVDRHGGVASRVVVGDGPIGVGPDHDPGPVTGLTVDALHRVLGLPAPGRPPPAPLMALAVWSQLLILHVLDHGALGWTDAVALHPGDALALQRDRPRASAARRRTHRTVGVVPMSTETIIEATLRTEGTLSWERLHRRAIDGEQRLDLQPDEVAWMDPTLYARWVLASLPDAQLAAEVLVAHDEHDTADRLLEVAAAVLEQLDDDPAAVNPM